MPTGSRVPRRWGKADVKREVDLSLRRGQRQALGAYRAGFALAQTPGAYDGVVTWLYRSP